MKNVVRYPDLRLRKAATPMGAWEISSLKDETANALELLATKGDGVALAANQAGSTWRFFVIDRQRADRDDEGKLVPTVVCNPTLVAGSPEMVEETEGCLSFPGLFFKIKRHAWVDVKFSYLAEDGTVVEDFPMRLNGFWGRVFQHEMEHLDGKTFVDHLPHKVRMQIANGLRLRMQKQGW